jgi:hypothetical protein
MAEDLKQALASARFAERAYRLAIEQPDTYPAVAEEIEEDEAEEEATRRSKWIAVLAALPDDALDDLLDMIPEPGAHALVGVLDEKPIEDIAIDLMIEFNTAHTEEEVSDIVRGAFQSIARHLGPFSKLGRDLDARLAPGAKDRDLDEAQPAEAA